MNDSRARIRTALAAVFWAIRFEAVVRRKRVPELADMAGVRFDVTPTSLPGAERDKRAPISADDVRTLRLVARLYRRWPGGGTCLRESLVAARLLRYRAPVLRIGVRPGPDRIRAHAWLEFGGVPVDPTAGDYLTLTHSAA